jgi:SAM-dependent methyltransferase
VSGTYRDVDASSAPEEAADWQDRINDWPAIGRAKRRGDELLAGSEPVVDVGCGTGGDLARWRGVGVDRSGTMLRRARARGLAVARADAAALPFATGSFGGARADRVLQHVDDPDVVLAELVRVVRPGGRVVTCDPDQSTLAIDVPWAPDELVDAVRRYRRDVQYRNGTLAGELPARFAAAGLTDVERHDELLVLDRPDDAFGLPTWVKHRHELDGSLTAADVRAWDAAMAKARAEPGFRYAVTYVVVAGTKPAP